MRCFQRYFDVCVVSDVVCVSGGMWGRGYIYTHMHIQTAYTHTRTHMHIQIALWFPEVCGVEVGSHPTMHIYSHKYAYTYSTLVSPHGQTQAAPRRACACMCTRKVSLIPTPPYPLHWHFVCVCVCTRMHMQLK